MASLNTLEVRGLSRFLNTIYANDLTVNGTFGTSGNMSVGGTLAVTGNTTISGTLTLSKTTDLSGTANNSPALIVGGTTTTLHMEIDNNEIQAKNDGTSVATLNINLDGGLVKMGSGGLEIAGALKATGTTTLGTANITTATVSTGNFTNANVSNVLRAARYDLQTVGQLGGAFYVSPTIVFPNNETSITVTKNGAVLTITIVDSSITATDTMAGIVWNTNAKVKVSGKIGNIVTGTMDGTITSINTNSHTLVLSVSGENSSSVVAGSYTASNISDLCVMLYNMGSNFNNYPVGILLNSYGTNSKSYIDIYGGTSPETSPNVRIGNLGGLVFNDSVLLPQWGLYTTNGYFSGTINANLGKIAGWTISNSNLTKISPAINNVRYSAIMQAPLDEGMTSSNIAFGVRTSTNNADWVYPFSVNYAGQLKTTDILATGGNIAGWAISSSSLTKISPTIDNVRYSAIMQAPADSGMASTNVAFGVRTSTNNADWVYPFVVKYDGSLKATNADISGKITATSGSINGSLVTSGINANNITAGTISVERLRSLEVGGRNLILKSSQSRTITLESATGGYYTDYYDESEYGKTVTNGNTTDYFVLSYDWSTTSETGAAWAQFNGTSIGQIAYVEGYKTSGTVERNKVDLSEGSGHYMAVFKFTSAQASAASQAPRIRIDGSVLAQTAGSTLTISNVKLERANVATAYSLAPEDTDADIQKTNLSPFFSHTLTDVYDTTTNPNGYWIKNGANGWADKSQFTFTRLEDGWLHVHIDNSSGTGIIRNDCCCPRYNPIIKPNTKYTFLIEFRNNTSTNIGTNSNIYLVQQGGGVQFWGTNVPTGSAVKLEGVGDSNVINLSVVPTDGSYVFNRSTKLSLDTTDTYYGTNMMMTYVFRADTGAILDYDIRISMYEGIYYGPYVPYKANNANYLYYDSTNGLIISENATGQTYNSASSGFNTQLKSDGLYIRNGSNVLAQYGDDILLKSSDDVNYLLIERTGLDVYNKHSVSIFNIVSNYDFAASTDYVYQLLSDKDINNDLNGKTIRGTISFSYYINTASLKDIQYKYENGVDFFELSSSKYTSTITLRNGEIDYEITFNSNAFSAGEERISDEGIDTITTSNIVDLRISFNRTVNSGYYNIGARKDSNDGIGLYSTIIGEKNVASRSYSVAMGYNSSSKGYCSYSLGQNVSVSGAYAFGTGYNTTTTGYISASMGSYNTASGSHSFARGYNNVVSGEYSFASGRYLNATTKDLTAIGRFNTTASYLNSDLLFVIGNGNSTSSRSNSTEIYKNGMIRMMGTYPALQITPTKPSTSPQDSLDRGGTIFLNTSTNSPQYAGVVMEQYQNSVRFYSLPSVDGTSYTGYGKEIKFDLRAGTITGNHKLNTTGYDTASITKGSNITMTTGSIIKKNGIVQVLYEFKPTASISAWANIGTIPNGFKPLNNFIRVAGNIHNTANTIFFQIDTGGNIYPITALTANTTYVVCFTYIANI